MCGLAHDVDEAGDREVDSVRTVRDVTALQKRWQRAAAGEVVEAGLARSKGIGFVLETAIAMRIQGVIRGPWYVIVSMTLNKLSRISFAELYTSLRP
jgi:hypothetical protein